MARKQRQITHYIPPARKFAELDVEFVDPVPDDYFIWWLFRRRCICCKQVGNEINEIVPRSRSKSAIMNWRNRVILCRNCHVQYHLHGVTLEKMKKMVADRKTFLMSIGREKYA